MRKYSYKNLTPKEIKQWRKKKEKEWDKNAGFWIKIIREKLDPYRIVITNKAVLLPLKGRKNLKILDAGCGEGYLSRILAKKGHRVVGIDSCPQLIEAAKDLERKKPLGIKYFVGDFRNTNFPSSYFDVVLSHQSIHEIENPEKALKQFARVLKRKGRLICLFLHPCFEINESNSGKNDFVSLYFSRVQVRKGKYLVSGIWSPSPYFYLHLPLSGWINLFKKAGFLIYDIKEPRPPANLLKKDRWWKEHFKKPSFILIDAIKI
jgi:SAM-dependent methyltransferase